MSRSLLTNLKTIIVLAQFFVTTPSFAKDITVFDIRRAVSLENNQEMPKDFYINAGLETGLKVGMVITVNRRQTLYDPYQSKSPGDLVVPVGKLRIIHTQESISVARMVEIMGREQLPGLEYDAIMVGDRLDMATAKMGKNTAMNESDAAGSAVVSIVEVQAAPIPVEAPAAAAPAPVVKAVTPAPTVASAPSTNAQSHESSSQLPATSLPTEGPTL